MGRCQTITVVITSPMISVLIGFVCGVVSGMGIGGGSILMVWLTAVLTVDQLSAQCINLLFFLPSCAAAIIFHAKEKTICWKAAVPAIIAGSIFSAAFAFLSTSVDVSILRKMFGGFLLIVGLIEIFKKNRKGQA